MSRQNSTLYRLLSTLTLVGTGASVFAQLVAYEYVPPKNPLPLVRNLERYPPQFMFDYARSLGSMNKDKRNMVERALRRICRNLRKLVRDKGPLIEAGYALAHALGRFGPQSIANIESLYRSPDRWQREMSAWSLQVFAAGHYRSEDYRALKLAAKMKQDRVDQVRSLGNSSHIDIMLRRWEP